MSLPAGNIAGIVICSVLILIIAIWMILFSIKWWIQGSTKGSRIKVNLDNKVVAITGCRGIGKITAHELSKKGARIILLARNVQKAQEVATEISRDTGHRVDVVCLDLASLASVRECAKKLLDTETKIDILINNAGVMNCPEWKTKDGFEMQIGTNHFGHFLLTELLRPLLAKSAATGFTPRIVIVSSMVHTSGKMNWDDLHYQKTKGSYNGMTAYNQSKLANVLHGAELAKRTESEGIHVYTLHPGAIATDLYTHMEKGIQRLFVIILKYVLKTPFHGAQTTLYCALDESIKNDSGKYYSDCAEKKPSKDGRNEDYQKRLWELSEEAVGLK